MRRAGECQRRYLRWRSLTRRLPWSAWPLLWVGLCRFGSEAAVATADGSVATGAATAASDTSASGVAAPVLDSLVPLVPLVQGSGSGVLSVGSAVAPADTLTPRGALLRSAILPGWGQLRNGKPVKAVFFAGAAGGFLTAAILDVGAARRAVVPAEKEDRVARRNTRFLYFFIAATLSAVDAFVDTHLADFGDEPLIMMSGIGAPSPGIRWRLSF